MENNKELETNNRIKAEKIRLAALFVTMDRVSFYSALGLIEQAAFLRITLQDLADEVAKTGPVEEYTNGANQGGRKISAALDAYNKSMKTYTKVVSELMSRVPHRHDYILPGADEHDIIAFRNFKDKEETDFYLSDAFQNQLEKDRAAALELMLQGN